MAGWGFGWCCCDGFACTTQYEQEFAGSSFDAEWSVDSGTWTVGSGTASTSNSDVSVELDLAALSIGSQFPHIQVIAKGTASGDQIRFGLGPYATGISVELQVGTSAKIRIYSHYLGTDYLTVECSVTAAANTDHTIGLRSTSISGAYEVVLNGSTVTRIYSGVTPAPGLVCHIGTGTVTGTVHFSQFWGYLNDCSYQFCPWPFIPGQPSEHELNLANAVNAGNFKWSNTNGTYFIPVLTNCGGSLTGLSLLYYDDGLGDQRYFDTVSIGLLSVVGGDVGYQWRALLVDTVNTVTYQIISNYIGGDPGSGDYVVCPSSNVVLSTIAGGSTWDATLIHP
ncbi:MAG: hypothetical protein SFX18_13340 [Pirellulales bacterium]|nr:hypothetical protein [Pirellulales bacterium]